MSVRTVRIGTMACLAASLASLSGCGIIMQHRGYYVGDDQGKNRFTMDAFMYSSVPIEGEDAVLLVEVDQEPFRTVTLGPILPVLPVLDHWDTDDPNGRDSVTVRVDVEADEPVTVDWDAVRLTTADGRPLHRVRVPGEHWTCCAPPDAVVYKAALPGDRDDPPPLLLTMPEFFIGRRLVRMPPVRLERRTITRYVLGM